MQNFKRSCSLGLATLLVAGLSSLAGAQQTDNKPSAAHKSKSSATASNPSTSDQNKSNLSSSDKSFLKDAAEGGLAEVELGQLASQKASSPEVKKFAERMVKDHTKANDELKQIAAQKGVDLPDKPGVTDRMTKARLSRLDGEKFDKAYMDDMVKDHKKDVDDFQKESAKGQDPDVKNFAAKTLPTLQEHLNEAQRIQPKTEQQAQAR
ncbi:MAG TPA: DUF4142 domain-containing protein [Terriglobales bacterium]|nr:DUF4142 domain-containing protein [Terriglobales bacterium]